MVDSPRDLYATAAAQLRPRARRDPPIPANAQAPTSPRPAACATTARVFPATPGDAVDIPHDKKATGKLPSSPPLPATPYEHYMACHDHPDIGHPMVFFIRLALAGEFQAGALEAALDAVRPRHPLLFSVLVGDRGGRTRDLAWHALGDDVSVRVFWYADDDDGSGGGGGGVRGDEWAWSSLNIRAEPGVRLHLARTASAGGTQLTAAFHHAATDGRGAMRFLEDVLAAHAGLAGGRGDPAAFLRPVDQALLTGARGQEWPRPGGGSALRQAGRFAVALVKWLANVAPPRLAAPADTLSGLARPSPRRGPRAAPPSPAHDAVIITLHPGEVTALRAAARAAAGGGATVNDALLTAVFTAADAWNSRHGGGGDGSHQIRVVIAQCLRDAASRTAAPAANIMGSCFMDRGRATIRGGRLLPSITAQTAHIKAVGLGWTCPALLAGVGAVPGAMARLFHADRPLATTYVSNLGVVLDDARLPRLPDGGLDAGAGVHLEGVTLILPTSVATPVTFGVATFRGRLQLAVRYDASTWSTGQARELAADVEACVRAMVGGSGGTPPLSSLPLTGRRRAAQSDAAMQLALEAGKAASASSWPPTPAPLDAVAPALSIRSDLDGAVVFLTGATGYIGSTVLERILRCTSAARVVCLVRGKRGLAPSARMERLVATRRLFSALRADGGGDSGGGTGHGGSVPSFVASRITAVEGDAQAPRLGLAPDAWASLTSSVTHIIHCAASISFDAPIHELLSQNYDSTAGVLALAAACGPHLRSVVHVSTAYVNGHLPRGSVVHESTYDLAGLDHAALAASLRAATPVAAAAATAAFLKVCCLPNAYCLSKHMAERLVVDFAAAAGKGAPGTAIVRPSIVGALAHGPAAGYVGNSSGATAYFLAFGTGMASFTSYRAYTLIDVVPGDIVANAILGASVAASAAATATGGRSGGDCSSATAAARPIILHAASSTSNPITHWKLFGSHVAPYYHANPSPIRFSRRYPSLDRSDDVYMADGSVWFSVRCALETAKFAAVAGCLRLCGRAAAGAALWAHWRTWCTVNRSALDFGVCFSVRNAAAVEAALPDDERATFPMTWSADRPADVWGPYMKRYLDEIGACYLTRAAGVVTGGGSGTGGQKRRAAARPTTAAALASAGATAAVAAAVATAVWAGRVRLAFAVFVAALLGRAVLS